MDHVEWMMSLVGFYEISGPVKVTENAVREYVDVLVKWKLRPEEWAAMKEMVKLRCERFPPLTTLHDFYRELMEQRRVSEDVPDWELVPNPGGHPFAKRPRPS